MVEVVECEVCGRKMGKKPKYTVDERDGHVCNDCWKEMNELELDAVKEQISNQNEQRIKETL